MSEKDATLPAPPRRLSVASEHLVAARIMGLLFAAPFLLGILEGSAAAAGAGLGLCALARVVRAGSLRTLVIPAFVVYGGAVAIGAARWGSAQLGLVRGAQAVLGPTVMVAPAGAAAAAIVAWIGGAIALGVWLDRTEGDPVELWGAEVLAGALLLVTVFWGPALPGLGNPEGVLRVATWIPFTALTAGAAAGIARLSSGRGRVVRGALVLLAVATTSVAGLLLDTAL